MILIINLTVILSVGSILWAVPKFEQPTVPMNVAVPKEHAGDPAIAVSYQKYQR